MSSTGDVEGEDPFAIPHYSSSAPKMMQEISNTEPISNLATHHGLAGKAGQKEGEEEEDFFQAHFFASDRSTSSNFADSIGAPAHMGSIVPEEEKSTSGNGHITSREDAQDGGYRNSAGRAAVSRALRCMTADRKGLFTNAAEILTAREVDSKYMSRSKWVQAHKHHEYQRQARRLARPILLALRLGLRRGR